MNAGNVNNLILNLENYINVQFVKKNLKEIFSIKCENDY